MGSGYVGLVSGACLAASGRDEVCIGKERGKIERLRAIEGADAIGLNRIRQIAGLPAMVDLMKKRQVRLYVRWQRMTMVARRKSPPHG